ncbi:MAG: hypothetical protein FWE02_02755, partial [Defluviitaleaceae bacterium]|nr:hypothetical protein [Defluviitaleaceae bacterium]
MELERLKRISELEDRKLAREILYNVHRKVEANNLEQYDILERQIYEEIKDPLEKFYIYTTMEYKENLDVNDEFMQPMLEVNNSIFLACNDDKLKKILSENRIYKGVVRTEENDYNVEVKLSQSYKYIGEIEKLYKIFRINDLEWHTINCPHVYRFVDLVFDLDIEEEEIVEIKVDLEEYEEFKKVNLVPLWNVQFLKIRDESFSITSDGLNYEHFLEISEQHGYLVDRGNEHYISFKYEEEKMIIISDYDMPFTWNMVMIKKKIERNYSYEIYSNDRNLNFLSRYAILNQSIVPTKGEVSRLVKLYDLGKEFEFVDIYILDVYDKEIKTRNFNSFMKDDIRIESYKRIMLITFRSKVGADNLEHEKISFFISEIQLYFPEYKCVGGLT